jgi:uncharacterized membrane protein (UPF0182 family)
VAFRAPGQPRPTRRPTALARWPRRLIPAVVIVIAVITVVCVIAGVWTDWLWFRSVGHTRTFAVTYGTKWALFAVAAVFMTAVVGFNAWLAYRVRPPEQPGGPRQPGPEAYRLVVDPHRRLVLAVLLGLIGLVSGLGAAGSWRTWLLFANRTSFGRKDPQFHLDISFFVFDYPFLRLVLSFLFAAVLLSVLVAGAAHYLYGGLRPQLRGERWTAAARAQLFVLVGAFILLKAGAYWVDRYAINFSQRGVVQTGASYTDVNAILPAKTVLAVIALICAVLFLAGAARRGSMLPAAGFGLLVLSAILLGGVYPAIIQQFVVKPNELTKESPFLTKEIHGTRAAYGLSNVRDTPYQATPTQSPAQLAQAAAALPDLRLADPGVMSLAFQQLRQVKSYYQFSPVLDIDRYQQPGSPVPLDMILGVRAMSGPPPGQDNWVNTHLVYTHGYGVVSAVAGKMLSDGNPSFTDSEIPEPPSGALGKFQPRVYFGERQTNYVIAGGRHQHELDYPDESRSGGGQQDSTYHGDGGVPVGSALHRLLYAVKYRQLNILLSGAIDSKSRILTVRDPLARVAKVAPFLTLDNDAYPVVADGKLTWVIDGYTTTDDYPYSARVGLRQATADTYAPGGAVTGPGGQVNYVRDSVKATVDAYTGQVALYQWDNSDPVLAAWKKAFPGLIQPRKAIPAALAPHLRYPPALFSVQRQILAQFHETNAAAFYGGQDFWSVPIDSATASAGKLNQPPYYLTMPMPGQSAAGSAAGSAPASAPEFSLITSFTQRGRPNMAAFLAVNSDPASSGYGQIQILELPQNSSTVGPQQAHSDFQSDTAASGDISLWRKGGSRVTYGNLITVPLGGGLLYTEPLYVSSDATGNAGAYPALRRVFTYFNGQVGYAPTLEGALGQVLGATSGQSASGRQGSLQHYLQQAQMYYTKAQVALRKLDYNDFGSDLAKMNVALKQAAKLAGGPAASGNGSVAHPRSGPSASPSPSPSASRSP